MRCQTGAARRLAELDKFTEAGCDPVGDEVTDWERDRYIEFT